MSDAMMFAIAKMPYEMAMKDELSRRQFYANTQRLVAALEAARAEVERLQEAVRPRLEAECLTMEHWRIRAYHLEENWSRCSRACAIEQDKREQAEARAERLEKALKDILSISSINSDANTNPFALTAVLTEIHYIADTALAKESKA